MLVLMVGGLAGLLDRVAAFHVFKNGVRLDEGGNYAHVDVQ